MKTARLGSALFFALVGIAACSDSSSTGAPQDGGSQDPPPIRASDYNQSCSAAADCALVTEGDVCTCLGCGNTAINQADVAKFRADVAAKEKLCPVGPPKVCPGLACVISEVTCVAGKCGACHSLGCADAGAPLDAPAD